MQAVLVEVVKEVLTQAACYYMSFVRLEDQGGISSVVVLESQFVVNRAIRMVNNKLICPTPERLYS